MTVRSRTRSSEPEPKGPAINRRSGTAPACFPTDAGNDRRSEPGRDTSVFPRSTGPHQACFKGCRRLERRVPRRLSPADFGPPRLTPAVVSEPNHEVPSDAQPDVEHDVVTGEQPVDHVGLCSTSGALLCHGDHGLSIAHRRQITSATRHTPMPPRVLAAYRRPGSDLRTVLASQGGFPRSKWWG